MKLLSLLSEYLGGGGYVQVTLNAPHEVSFGDKAVQFKELWGRINIASDKAVLTFDDVRPKPTFSTTVLTIPVNGTINGLEVTDSEVVAVTTLGNHSIWKQGAGDMSNDVAFHGDREAHALLREASHAERIGRRNVKHGRPVDAHGGITTEQFDQIEDVTNDPQQWAEMKRRIADEGVKRGAFKAEDVGAFGTWDWTTIFNCAAKILPIVISILPFLLAPKLTTEEATAPK